MPAPRLLCALAAVASLGLPATATAEAGLRLPAPHAFTTVPAATYDTGGARVGEAHVVVERQPGGVVRLGTETGFEAGPRTVVAAALEPVADGSLLRPLWQESRSFGPDGTPLGLLRIDHRRGVATCVPGPEIDPRRAEHIELPEADRVANVTLNLLFLPLARAQAEQVEFQIFICRGGPRLIDFQARVAGRRSGARPWVEVRYGPDLGALGLLLTPMLPRLSVWLDPQARLPWLAHRIPLYAQGPEVLVVRDGVAPGLLVSQP